MKLENYDPALHHLLTAIPEIADAGCASDHIHYLTQAVSTAPPLELRPGLLHGVSRHEARSAARTLLTYLKQHIEAEQNDPVATLNYELDGALSAAAWDATRSERELLSMGVVLLDKIGA